MTPFEREFEASSPDVQMDLHEQIYLGLRALPTDLLTHIASLPEPRLASEAALIVRRRSRGTDPQITPEEARRWYWTTERQRRLRTVGIDLTA